MLQIITSSYSWKIRTADGIVDDFYISSTFESRELGTREGFTF